MLQITVVGSRGHRAKGEAVSHFLSMTPVEATKLADWHVSEGPDGADNVLVIAARRAIRELLTSDCSATEVYNGLMYIRDGCNEALCKLNEAMDRITMLGGGEV